MNLIESQSLHINYLLEINQLDYTDNEHQTKNTFKYKY